MSDTDPSFPPLLNSKPVWAPKRPFDVACLDVQQGDAAAGDIYWAKNNRVLDCAIVLEPEVPFAQSLQMAYVVMVAFGDAFGALAEPEVGLYYHWPDKFIVNGAQVGHLRIAAPVGLTGDQVPDWMIFNLVIDVQGDEDVEPGDAPDQTTLLAEGCAEVTCIGLMESFCRHFLTWVHNWEEEGFRPVHDLWIGRAIGSQGPAEFQANGKTYTGKLMGVDEASQLLLSEDGKNLTTLELQHMIEWQKER